MTMPLEEAAEVYREALRRSVRRYAPLFLSEGALLSIIGLITILYPLIWSTEVAVVLGWLLIVTAAAQATVLVIGMRGMPYLGFQLLSAVVALVVGALLIRDPQQTRQTIVVLVIIFPIVQGASRIIFGLTIRPFPHWEWVMGSGVLGVPLSLALLSSFPEPAMWLVTLLVGIEFIAEGGAIAFLAWRVTVEEGASR